MFGTGRKPGGACGRACGLDTPNGIGGRIRARGWRCGGGALGVCMGSRQVGQTGVGWGGGQGELGHAAIAGGGVN